MIWKAIMHEGAPRESRSVLTAAGCCHQALCTASVVVIEAMVCWQIDQHVLHVQQL